MKLHELAEAIGYMLFAAGLAGTILRGIIASLGIGYGAKGCELQLLSFTSGCFINLAAGYMLIMLTTKPK